MIASTAVQHGGHLSAYDRASRAVAYFSMEIAVQDGVPTYSGGLGVLAGDHLRSAADLGLPLVGVTLLYRRGYFSQRLDDDGRQSEEPVEWSPEEALTQLPERVTVTIEGRQVLVGAWYLEIPPSEPIGSGDSGPCGRTVPVYFLDTDVDGNDPRDRQITDQLYSGDLAHRLHQEVVLGMGGRAMLDRLGYRSISCYHMNEGHSSLLALSIKNRGCESSPETAAERGSSPEGSPGPRCVFTTHTPVPAGHDHFPAALVEEVVGDEVASRLVEMGCLASGELNMTDLGMCSSEYVNAVSIRHQHVAQAMFPQYKIASITNGVHAPTWTAPSFQALFDLYLPGWRHDSSALRSAVAIPLEEIVAAHQGAKATLCREVAARCKVSLDPVALTIGVARRAAGYKRTDLILSDPDRLVELSAKVGPIQIVYSGKAHPQDDQGKQIIASIVEMAHQLRGTVEIVYVPDYSMELAAVLTAGVDVWLNTPRKPLEACGTSGMKAALNGVPSLSILDGWWLEGHVEGVTGWSIGDDGPTSDDDVEADDLYRKLKEVVAPLFYEPGEGFTRLMRYAIALNGSYFNTERMVRQYATRSYHLAADGSGVS